jgi:hypothetical protein
MITLPTEGAAMKVLLTSRSSPARESQAQSSFNLGVSYVGVPSTTT